MDFTISNSQGSHAEEHSRRSYIPFSAEESLLERNVIIYDCGNDRLHLNETAQPYIHSYNEKQKRKDRKKDYEFDYVSALEDGRACYGVGDKKEKPFHHDVIQIGNRNTNGLTDENFDVDHWRELRKSGDFSEAEKYVKEHLNKSPEREELKQILVDVGEELLQECCPDGRYPNILVHGIILHDDEPNGTAHLDFRYSIFIDSEKTGLPWRISDKKGLEAMGFKTDSTQTALQKFREDFNSCIEEKLKEHGYGREVKGEHGPHLSTAQYEVVQRLKEQQAEIDYNDRIIDAQENIISDNQPLIDELDKREAEIAFKDAEATTKLQRISELEEQAVANEKATADTKSQWDERHEKALISFQLYDQEYANVVAYESKVDKMFRQVQTQLSRISKLDLESEFYSYLKKKNPDKYDELTIIHKEFKEDMKKAIEIPEDIEAPKRVEDTFIQEIQAEAMHLKKVQEEYEEQQALEAELKKGKVVSKDRELPAINMSIDSSYDEEMISKRMKRYI